MNSTRLHRPWNLETYEWPDRYIWNQSFSPCPISFQHNAMLKYFKCRT